MSALLGIEVLVKNVHFDSIQGEGIVVDMNDFSDQTMTLAAIAPFATSETIIKNISHIRFQETDRIGAIVKELTKLGIRCEESEENDGIFIQPGNVLAGVVETYDDHRMAMAFTLIGLRVGGVIIKNYKCCSKTFENYFDIIDQL